jgi:hypothetical protein
MTREIILNGTVANDGTGDTLRRTAEKINNNFFEVYSTLANTAPANAALNDLSDVTITSPSNGQVLKYNGTIWVNGTDAGTTGNPFDQNLNTGNSVSFVTTTSDEFILGGSGTPTIESQTDIFMSAIGKIEIITKSAFRMATMTTSERNALANTANGDVIFNSTTGKFQGYAGSWIDLH